MLECSYTPLKPVPSTKEFYRYFFSQYSFVQVNDLCMRFAADSLSGLGKIFERTNYLSFTINYKGSEYEENSVYLNCMGIKDPALERHKKEDRGFSEDLFSVFSKLSNDGRNPLTWYLTINEFLLTYSVCERTLIFLLSESDSVHKDDAEYISENKIFSKLTEFLQRQVMLEKYKKELKIGSNECFHSLEDVNAVWLYYTLLRHCIAHSAGVWNQNLFDRMQKYVDGRLKNVEMRLSSHPIYLGTYSLDDNPFFRNYEVGSIIDISEHQMNFFRNTVLRIIEGLERIYRASSQTQK